MASGWIDRAGSCATHDGCCGPECYGKEFTHYIQPETLTLEGCKQQCLNTEGCISVTYSNFYANEYKESYKKYGCQLYNNVSYVYGSCNGGYVCASLRETGNDLNSESISYTMIFVIKHIKYQNYLDL